MMGYLAIAQKSIVILYENDAHCGIDGYTKMAGLRDAINQSDTAYAAAVCCGDFLQGNTTGAISKGQYIADILRLMDYHALTLGNHEFDYGVPRMNPSGMRQSLRSRRATASFCTLCDSSVWQQKSGLCRSNYP